MKYRRMGSLGWEVSALGFGCMRLPTNKIKDEETNQIKTKLDEAEAIKIIRHGIDNGINYIDTAWPYHEGESEILVGKALKDGYRLKVKLVTKSPTWLIKEAGDFDNFLYKQLEKLQTSYLDIYLFHGLNQSRFKLIKEKNLIIKMEEAREKGLIKHFGFSFHDNFKTFKEIVDYYDWDATQIQHNYMDIEYQAGTMGLRYAADKGIAVIIMEPIQGGKLAKVFPKIDGILKSANSKRKLADWALQFLWNQPEVSVVLSGMSAKWMVDENLESADNSGINALTNYELKVISDLRAVYREYISIPCTNCEYCLPCPNSVNIPFNFRILNDFIWYGEELREKYLGFYNRFLCNAEEIEQENNGNASVCTQCGECLEKCPQQINIPEELKKVDLIFAQSKKISEVMT
ncbi:MAG: aldo/keto reductase [Candidatus Thorarchaeota archaeon]